MDKSKWSQQYEEEAILKLEQVTSVELAINTTFVKKTQSIYSFLFQVTILYCCSFVLDWSSSFLQYLIALVWFGRESA